MIGQQQKRKEGNASNRSHGGGMMVACPVDLPVQW
jgi:hypothetical protein